MAASAATGYAYENRRFADPLPDDLVCLVCHSAAKDAHQTTCCEKRVPLAGDLESRTFVIKTVSDQRTVRALKVACDKEESGCGWTGELGELEQHLSTECMFAVVACPNNCSTTNLLRKDLDNHRRTECPRREYVCPRCGEPGQSYRDMAVVSVHLNDSGPNMEIPCPNFGCSYVDQRRSMSTHRRVCPKERVRCQYSNIGCTFRGLQEDMGGHNTTCMEHHLRLATTNLELVEEMVKVPPQVFKLPHFEIKKACNGRWYSPSFYTHPGGYKMCLSVFTNGAKDGRDTHISVFIHLLPGGNDKNLLWPFKGHVTIELLNQIEDYGHLQMVIRYDQTRDTNATANAEISRGLGYTKFVSHVQLHEPTDGTVSNCQYLKDDCVFFRVKKVKVDPANKPWLTTSYSKQHSTK